MVRTDTPQRKYPPHGDYGGDIWTTFVVDYQIGGNKVRVGKRHQRTRIMTSVNPLKYNGEESGSPALLFVGVKLYTTARETMRGTKNREIEYTFTIKKNNSQRARCPHHAS